MVARGLPIRLVPPSGISRRNKRSLRRLLSGILILSLLYCGQFAQAQEPQGGTDKAALLALQSYLDADCGVRVSKVLVNNSKERKSLGPLGELLKFREDEALVNKLITILQTGLDQDMGNQAKTVVLEQLKARQRFLKKSQPPGTGMIQPTPVERVTKEVYLERELNRLNRTYKQKAAVALVAIGSPRGNEALDMVGRRDRELAKVIRAARSNDRLAELVTETARARSRP